MNTRDNPNSILHEALRITGSDGERARDYGGAYDDAERWAKMFGALTGFDVRPEHQPLALLCLKLSRTSQAPDCFHRDSIVDIAGWARVAEMIHDEQAARAVDHYANRGVRRQNPEDEPEGADRPEGSFKYSGQPEIGEESPR